ncbi:hypothetical protein Gpo141_00011577 [Globisporangium polare]
MVSSSRRNSSTGSRRLAPPSPPPPASKSKSKSKSKTRVKSEVGPDLSALQNQLTRQLQQTIEDTVGAVCDDFQDELKASFAAAVGAGGKNGQKQMAIPAAAKYGAASTADYEVYYSCCQRLVAYIAANMSTSPDFVKQMDRIILACHSGASERVLRSVATKNVWFHRRDGGVPDTASDETDEVEEVEEVERPPPTRAPSAAKGKSAAPAKKKASGRTFKKEMVSPARSTRAAAKKTADAPPPRAASKRRSSAAPTPSPVAKRQRPAARRSLPLPKYDDEDEEEEEEDYEEDNDAGVEVDQDEEDQEEEDDDESASNQPHYETPDELLDFKDPVRDMCYVDKRTPAQTKFFKERLRKAILFVDAQLCKPPPGKVCARDCKKIRAVMCDRNLPCRNKICRVWHDVEVHIDRCQNTHCELKNRIMLRETMHKIDHKKLQIHNAKLEVAEKKKLREDIKNGEANERKQYIELTLLSNEIDELESDIAAAEEELGILNGTKKAFWACLNVVGIELKDDVADGFPDLASHYANKKQSAPKVVRAPKRAAKDQEGFVPNYEPPSMRDSNGDAQDEAGLNDDGGFGGPMAPITRRTTRRSTTKSFQAMAMDVESVESDEEAKSAENGDEGGDAEEDAEDATATDADEAATTATAGDDQGRAVNNIRTTDQNGGGSSSAPRESGDGADNANDGDGADDDNRYSLEYAETQDLNDLSELMAQNGTDSNHSTSARIVVTGQRLAQVTAGTTSGSTSVSSTSRTTRTTRTTSAVRTSVSTVRTFGELGPLPISNIQVLAPSAAALALQNSAPTADSPTV